MSIRFVQFLSFADYSEFIQVPDIELSTGSSPRNFYSNPEMEQVVVLSFLGERAIDESGLVLQSEYVLNIEPQLCH